VVVLLLPIPIWNKVSFPGSHHCRVSGGQPVGHIAARLLVLPPIALREVSSSSTRPTMSIHVIACPRGNCSLLDEHDLYRDGYIHDTLSFLGLPSFRPVPRPLPRSRVLIYLFRGDTGYTLRYQWGALSKRRHLRWLPEALGRMRYTRAATWSRGHFLQHMQLVELPTCCRISIFPLPGAARICKCVVYRQCG
jgi:hypothetical protein